MDQPRKHGGELGRWEWTYHGYFGFSDSPNMIAKTLMEVGGRLGAVVPYRGSEDGLIEFDASPFDDRLVVEGPTTTKEFSERMNLGDELGCVVYLEPVRRKWCWQAKAILRNLEGARLLYVVENWLNGEQNRGLWMKQELGADGVLHVRHGTRRLQGEMPGELLIASHDWLLKPPYR